jgi:hypothetical protein
MYKVSVNTYLFISYRTTKHTSVTLKLNVNLTEVRFIGLHYTIILQYTAQITLITNIA